MKPGSRRELRVGPDAGREHDHLALEPLAVVELQTFDARVAHQPRRGGLYRQLAERSWRLANALRSAGLCNGDRVATLLFNSSAMLEAHFGVPAAGGILVAVNYRLATAEIAYILEHSGARYLLLDAELEALVAPLELAGVTVIRCANTGVPDDP
jgi:fatty-acyl-CoA synthase